MQIGFQKFILRGLLSISIFLSTNLTASAQDDSSVFDASLVIQKNADSNALMNGGVYYQDDKLSLSILVDKPTQEKFYCYVFVISEGMNAWQLVYPNFEVQPSDRFPLYAEDGKLIKHIKLASDIIVCPPYTTDNWLLLMTEKPMDNPYKYLKKEDLLLLIKGNKLSALYNLGLGKIRIKNIQVDARPRIESRGLVNAFSPTNVTNLTPGKNIFVVNDSSEVFYTPKPQNDIVRDSFPTIDITSPDLDTNNERGIKSLKESNAKKILIKGIAVDWKRGIKTISVNNHSPGAYRESSGYFDYLYELKNGVNTIDISVENLRGFKRILRYRFEYHGKEKQIAKPGRNYLMVIGINNYKSGWPQLNNAVKDAKDFESLMLEKYGYSSEDVRELFNEQGTRKRI